MGQCNAMANKITICVFNILAIKKAKEKTLLKMNQFTKGIKFFQDYLGFTFKKIDGNYYLTFTSLSFIKS